MDARDEEIKALRAEIERLWDAVAPLMPPLVGKRVTATKAHADAGVPIGQIGKVAAVHGRIRRAYFSTDKLIDFDISDPNCGMEWGK